MWYIIKTVDTSDALEKRKRLRPDHLAYLQHLRNEGRLLLAGPIPAIDAEDPGSAGFQGSLIIAEFASLAAANAWADKDPYALGGAICSRQVLPFKKVF